MKEMVMTDFEKLPTFEPRALRARMMVVVVIGAIALCAGGVALAAAGWGQPDRHGPHLARIQSFVRAALDSVGATSAQEAKAHDIIATNLANVGPDPKVREQALALLSAPAVDPAAADKLRAEIVANFDARSKMIEATVLEIAAELTPEQRVKLVERAHRWAPMERNDGADAPDKD
jgi:periplasmic protein CpxP/Spy